MRLGRKGVLRKGTCSPLLTSRLIRKNLMAKKGCRMIDVTLG